MNIFLLEKKSLLLAKKRGSNRMIENEEKQFIKVVFLFFFSTCVNYRKNRLQSSVVYAFELLMEFNATKSKHFIELFEILYSYCLNRFTTYYTQ